MGDRVRDRVARAIDTCFPTTVCAVLAVVATLHGWWIGVGLFVVLAVVNGGLAARRWQERWDAASPPRNVRMVYLDGSVLPLELVYSGRSRGLAQWTAVHPIGRTEPGMRLEIDWAPPRSEINIAVAD